MKKALLLPLLCLTGLVGCGSTQAETKPYDTGWVEVANDTYGTLKVYIHEEVASYYFEGDVTNFKYRYCSYDNFAEMTVKYTSTRERTDYFCGTNLTYHFEQYN